MADNTREEQEGYPKSIATDVHELKRQAVTMFHNDHADGDTAIYYLLSELAPLITKAQEQLIQSIPQGLYIGANRYDTDDTVKIHLWNDKGESFDIEAKRKEIKEGR